MVMLCGVFFPNIKTPIGVCRFQIRCSEASNPHNNKMSNVLDIVFPRSSDCLVDGHAVDEW